MSNFTPENYITITDEDGKEYELEVLAEMEYQDAEYLAVIPAGSDDGEEGELEVSILKRVLEDGEEILATVDDETELEAVYGVMMDMLYEEDEEEQK